MTSFRRTCVPFNRYSFCPSRYTTRSTATSLKSRSSHRLQLSNKTFTAARFMRGKAGDPPHIKSSPRFERMDFIDCSPRTKRNASATFDFPLPFGPTMEAMAAPNRSSVFFPNDLNPVSSIDFKYITNSLQLTAFTCQWTGAYKTLLQYKKVTLCTYVHLLTCTMSHRRPTSETLILLKIAARIFTGSIRSPSGVIYTLLNATEKDDSISSREKKKSHEFVSSSYDIYKILVCNFINDPYGYILTLLKRK